ncbi:S9 family peptidase [Roseateles sp. LYH14W]|uniref:S9 family peptidase n=1 Tax=Pelomonas parva TaxID=3299032 RepID=A0ABW7F9S5_9BURK
MAGFLQRAALALTLLAAAAQAAPPPAELFYKDAELLDVVLSPSGRKLAFTTSRGTDRVALVVMDLDQGGKLNAVARFKDGDVHDVRWVDDERLVYGVVDLFDGSARYSGAPGLFAVNADGSKFRQLVRRQWKPVISDGSGDKRLLDWHHRVIKVPRMNAGGSNDEVLVAEFSPGADDDTEVPKWLNTRTGLTRNVDFTEPQGAVGWMADSRGDMRVVFTRREGRQAALWRAPGSKTWTPLYESDLLSSPFNIEAVDDAGGLYVSEHEGAAGQATLKRYDFERKRPQEKALVATPGFDFDGGLVIDETNGRVLGVHLLVDAPTIAWFDPAMKVFQDRVDKLFPGNANLVSCRRCGTPDMVAMVRSFSDRDPGRFYLFQGKPAAGEKAWTDMGARREGVKPQEMASVDLQRIKARDGLEVPVWITRPANTTGALPAVVLVHGGPWVRGGTWGWDADAQFLASRGYVVIEPEFRGSTGYGDAHFRASFKQWGLAMQDDVTDALRWAQKQGIASDKACIAGASYGGYSTLMGLVRDPDLYRCGVAWLAVTDLDLYAAGSWWVRDDIGATGRRYTIPEAVGDPVKDAALLAANSPVKQAARIKAPVLLAFNEGDRRVPMAHGDRMRKALREAGNEPVWVTYAGEGHGFGNVKNRVDFAQRMAAFLAKHLGENP